MGFRKDFVWGAATSAYQIEGAVKEDGKPIDVYGQNIYNGYCVRMGEDGRSETVSRYEGFPKTAIVDRKSIRLNSSHWNKSRMPSSA